MLLNNYEVVVPEGQELENGQVLMDHGQQYTVCMYNNHGTRCRAEISIDGKDVGVFRINAYGNLQLEHPSEDYGCFTFFRLNSPESKKALLHDVFENDLGLIKVTFIPEKKPDVTLRSAPRYAGPSYHTRGTYSGVAGGQRMGSSTVFNQSEQSVQTQYNVSPGGTGLSGQSNQSFRKVPNLNIDKNKAVTIYLRLVAHSEPDIRPLNRPMQTDIPPVAKI